MLCIRKLGNFSLKIPTQYTDTHWYINDFLWSQFPNMQAHVHSNTKIKCSRSIRAKESLKTNDVWNAKCEQS